MFDMEMEDGDSDGEDDTREPGERTREKYRGVIQAKLLTDIRMYYYMVMMAGGRAHLLAHKQGPTGTRQKRNQTGNCNGKGSSPFSGTVAWS